MNFDNRTTARVEETRSMVNGKPYRNAAEKAEARKSAILCKDGTWRSNVPVRFHGKGSRE